MSTFGGLMVEYQHIAIDRFQGPAVLRARAYFLSHAHADHMVGLDSSQFAQRLRLSKHIKLYCSEVTCEFLLTDRRFVHLGPFVASLPIEEPTTITLRNEIDGSEEQVLVTLLAAGHCPGSVMFLFEGQEGNVLYTGDFRLAKGEAARMLPLHSGNRVKDIKTVYVDTTFCVPEAMCIPSREQSRDALLDLVEKQIEKSPTHMVRLACKAKYGYEYLFVEISKEFNLKVHVSPVVMAQYQRVPDLAKHLTTDGRSTQVHACRYVDCAMNNATDVLVVVPSTMWFTSNAKPSDVLKKVGCRHRLCFSFHSSFSEIRDFVGYIRPVNIYPNVIPYNCTEEMISERLQDLRRGADKAADVKGESGYKPLGQLKKSSRRFARKIAASCASDGDSEDDLFHSSPSPHQKRKKHKPDIKELLTKVQDPDVLSVESGAFPEGSTQHSYLAMDDSDLSSSELDLFDSPPVLGQSQPVENSQERSTLSELGTGGNTESSVMDRAPFQSRDSPRKRREDNSPLERGKVADLTEKQLQQESKCAAIDSWLKYLPNADMMQKSLSPKEEGSPGKASRSETDLGGDVESVGGVHCSEIKQCDTGLNNSQGESDKTEEYSFRKSQEMPVPDEENLCNTPRKVSVKTEENITKFPGDLNWRSSDACEQDKIDSITEPQVAFENFAAEPTKCDNLTLIDLTDDTSPQLQQDVVSVTPHKPIHKNIIKSDSCGTVVLTAQKPSVVPLPEPYQEASARQLTDENPGHHKSEQQSHEPLFKNIIQSKSHGTVVLSSQASSIGSVVPLSYQGTSETQITDEHSELSQATTTSQSQDTFLPSSQGSIASRGSSDFDVPCTPECKGLHQEQVEAVHVKIARGQPVSLASCKRTIKLD